MVLQYKLKSDKRWKKYPGKDKLEKPVGKYEFRLLNEKKTKVLAQPGTYTKVMKRFRQIEFFKHKKASSGLSILIFIILVAILLTLLFLYM